MTKKNKKKGIITKSIAFVQASWQAYMGAGGGAYQLEHLLSCMRNSVWAR